MSANENRNENKIAANIGKTLSTLALIASVAFGMPHDAEAARSGGRVGGRSFSAPRSAPVMRSAPRQAAPRQAVGVPGGGVMRSTTIVPVPIPIGGGGYGYGGGFGYGYNPFFSPFRPAIGFGVNPIDLLLIGGAIYGATSLLKASTSGSSWGAVDDESRSALGQGVSVLKLQVALDCRDRSRSSILGQLGQIADSANTRTRKGLSSVVGEICLSLIRKQEDWRGVASAFEYFPARNAERAEAVFNTYAINERAKVERETVARFGGDDMSSARKAEGVRPGQIGLPTQAVVTLVVSLRGDSLKQVPQIEGGRGISGAAALKAALSRLASDVITDEGENVLGVELLWTPEEAWEVLERQDVIQDFPELIDV